MGMLELNTWYFINVVAFIDLSRSINVVAFIDLERPWGDKNLSYTWH